ncbi:hypothetical protein RJT34_15832 [Clitoria ternatea]|uniref:Uncharacterized protein n=1 Tax=Clitoria ternatea TaxID=43366 RepID=A0AAN9J6C2_CLITE
MGSSSGSSSKSSSPTDSTGACARASLAIRVYFRVGEQAAGIMILKGLGTGWGLILLVSKRFASVDSGISLGMVRSLPLDIVPLILCLFKGFPVMLRE